MANGAACLRRKAITGEVREKGSEPLPRQLFVSVYFWGTVYFLDDRLIFGRLPTLWVYLEPAIPLGVLDPPFRLVFTCKDYNT